MEVKPIALDFALLLVALLALHGLPFNAVSHCYYFSIYLFIFSKSWEFKFDTMWVHLTKLFFACRHLMRLVVLSIKTLKVWSLVTYKLNLQSAQRFFFFFFWSLYSISFFIFFYFKTLDHIRKSILENQETLICFYNDVLILYLFETGWERVFITW